MPLEHPRVLPYAWLEVLEVAASVAAVQQLWVVRSGHVRPSYVRPSHVRSSNVRPSYVRSSHARPCGHVGRKTPLHGFGRKHQEGLVGHLG